MTTQLINVHFANTKALYKKVALLHVPHPNL